MPYLRGYGPTRFIDAAAPRVGQQAALGNDLLALLDSPKLRKATLAGFDWGARAACVVAALHPDRVSGLVSSGGPGFNIQNVREFLKPRDAAFERRHWFYWYLNAQRGRKAFSNDPTGFCRYLWHDFSPGWNFDDTTFAQTALAFDNPDFVTVALHCQTASERDPGSASNRDPIVSVARRPLTSPTERVGVAQPG